MKKETAIEWLIRNLNDEFPTDENKMKYLFEEALLIEKSQIIDAYLKNRKKGNFIYVSNLWDDSIKYYEEVYINF